MKLNLVSVALLIVTTFISCESSKLKKEAGLQATEFFSVLKNGDDKKLERLYPGFSKFDTYYKSDSVRINSISEKSGLITVSIHNRFTNSFGKVTEKDISLLFKKDSAEQLRIIDSKGLCGFDEQEKYIFGVKSGCINSNYDTTDQQILKAIKNGQCSYA